MRDVEVLDTVSCSGAAMGAERRKSVNQKLYMPRYSTVKKNRHSVVFIEEARRLFSVTPSWGVECCTYIPAEIVLNG